ncbi:MAG: saccharopine dehydrogenase NADP-binding domain-containing protein, partial [Pseudomonadota bacterium]
MQREYDLVIWGATGFTGKLVTEYVANQYDQSNLKWAIAGRNRQKLEGIDGARGLNILEADAHDPAALKTLVESTRVILTTVGPYARYGNELVAACARAGTHYCDLTGETHWVRRMIQLHQDEAEQSGAIIVPSCGFDSIPSDLGTYALQKEMQARHGVAANRVTYRARDMRGGFSGGTIDSMMAMMEQAEDDPELFKIAADPYNLNFRWRGL